MNIVKHLQKYPNDSVAAAAENVLAFDRHELELIETLTSVFESEGITGIIADAAPQYVVGITVPSPLGRSELRSISSATGVVDVLSGDSAGSDATAAAASQLAEYDFTKSVDAISTNNGITDNGAASDVGGILGLGRLWSDTSPVECEINSALLKTKNSGYLLSASKEQPPSERNVGRQQQFTEAVVQLRGDAVEGEYACADESGTVHVLSRSPSQLQSFDAASKFESTTVLDLEPLLGKMPCSGMEAIPGSPGVVLIHCAGAGVAYKVDVTNTGCTTMFFPAAFTGEHTIGRDPISSYIRRTLSSAGRNRADSTRAVMVPAPETALYAYRAGGSDLLRVDWDRATSHLVTLPDPIAGPVVCTTAGRVEVTLESKRGLPSLLEIVGNGHGSSSSSSGGGGGGSGSGDGGAAVDHDADVLVARLFSPQDGEESGGEDSAAQDSAVFYHAFSPFGSLQAMVGGSKDSDSDAPLASIAAGSGGRGCVLSVATFPSSTEKGEGDETNDVYSSVDNEGAVLFAAREPFQTDSDTCASIDCKRHANDP